MIERVKQFNPELRAGCLGDFSYGNVLRYREIHVYQTGSDQDIPAGIAQQSCRHWKGKAFRLDEMSRIPRIDRRAASRACKTMREINRGKPLLPEGGASYPR